MTRRGKDSRPGLGGFLAGLRIVFNNPLTRAYLRAGTRRVKCETSEGEREAPIIYYALSQLAGVSVDGCPVYARFLSFLIRNTIAVGVRILRGDPEKAREALRDPAVRRGISLVIEGLARYGVTVPQRLPAPFLIVWNFTNMCNLRCIHCYQRADRPRPDELSLEEKLRLVDDLDRAGVAAVALSGGEPTIHPHFLRIVRELSDRGIYVSVATNGTVFARMENLEKAVRAGLRYVEVSVDSARPEVHDRFRGVPGAWEKAVQALRNAVKLGVNNGMATTITKLNYHELDDIIDLAEDIGVRRLILFNFVPVGRGEENAWLDLSPEEREEMMRKIFRESRKRGLEIVTTAPQYSRVALQLSGGEIAAPTHFYAGGDRIVRALAEFIGGCGAGRIYAAVQPNGDVTPCVFMPVRVGNVREKSFREIWETSPLFLALRDRDRLKGFCGKCPYRYVCGGCRARALAYTGDPLGPDPGCIYNRRVWEEIAGRHKIRVRLPGNARGGGGEA